MTIFDGVGGNQDVNVIDVRTWTVMIMTMMMITGVPASKMSMWKMTTTAMMISMVMITRVILMTMVMITGVIMMTMVMIRRLPASV